MATAIGPGHNGLYILVKVTVGLAAVAYLRGELTLTLCHCSTGLVSVTLFAYPRFTNMMHGLSYQGYSLALLLMQLGLCVRVVRTGTFGRGAIAARCVVAFCQGAMGFDYVFLVVLAPLVTALVLGERVAAA